MRIALVTFWIFVLGCALIVYAAGRAYDNYIERSLPVCSNGVCVAPKDATP